MDSRIRRVVPAAPSILTALVLLGVIVLLPVCDGTTPSDDEEGVGRNRNWAGTYLRVHLVPRQQPQLGEYSSRSPAVIQQHVEWAAAAGIDFFAIAWRGTDSYGHTSLIDHVIPEPSFDGIQWCILYETPTVIMDDPDPATINLTLAARDTLLRHLLDFHNAFFPLPNYLHMDGRPVIILRHSRRIAGNARIALNAIRQAYSDSTLGESYFMIGDEAMWSTLGAPNTSRIRAMDAITGIDLGVMTEHDGHPQATGFLNDLTTMWQEYAMEAQGLDPPVLLIPMVWPGFNDQASSVVQHPVIARELAAGNQQQGGTYRQMWEIANDQAVGLAVVLLNSFNSWRLDTQIEPVADNLNTVGTMVPTSVTGGVRYFPYQESYIEDTADNKGVVLLGAIYEVWYDDEPPPGL